MNEAFHTALDALYQTPEFRRPGVYHIAGGADLDVVFIVTRHDPLTEMGTPGARRPGWKASVRVSDLQGHEPVSYQSGAAPGDTITVLGRTMRVVDRELDKLRVQWDLDVDEVEA